MPIHSTSQTPTAQGQSLHIGGNRTEKGCDVVVFSEQIRNESSILEVGNLSCIHFLEDGPVCYVNGQSDVDFVVDMRMLSLV